MCAPSLEQWTPPHRSQAWTIACVAAWLVSGGPVVEVLTMVWFHPLSFFVFGRCRRLG